MPTACTQPPGYVRGSSLATHTNTSCKYDDDYSSLDDEDKEEEDDTCHYHNFEPADSQSSEDDEDDNDIQMPLCLPVNGTSIPALPPTNAVSRHSNTAAASASLCNTTGHKRKDIQPLPYQLLTARRSKKRGKRACHRHGYHDCFLEYLEELGDKDNCRSQGDCSCLWVLRNTNMFKPCQEELQRSSATTDWLVLIIPICHEQQGADKWKLAPSSA